IGARPFLVAYNIYLDTADVGVAKEIAKRIRTSSGGLPAVQASGFDVDGKAQVSMNLLDVDVTPPVTVFAAVEAEARARGVGVVRSEIVGLIPERALLGAAASSLKLPDPTAHVLEEKIRAAEGPTLDAWLDELASAAPVPGGGSAAAVAGAIAAALVAMVARLTIGRKAYAEVQAEVEKILGPADQLRTELRLLADVDAAAYAKVTAAYKLPKDDPGRGRAIDRALIDAAAVPLLVAQLAAGVLVLAGHVARIGNKNARSDAHVGMGLARAAGAGALANVRVNLAGLSDAALGAPLAAEADRLERELTPPS
ncbi:MAG: cyclodeaminase/cyclohydrolase family protein, partial [Gemmatimonadales bacterium]